MPGAEYERNAARLTGTRVRFLVGAIWGLNSAFMRISRFQRIVIT
jgi:hypothetical protein